MSDLLRARLDELPRCLRATASTRAGAPIDGSVVVTGIGASEAPARYAARLLRDRARAAFVPLSAFATDPPHADVLVVFSQGLSPNARLALARAKEHRRAILFTSPQADRAALARFPGEVVMLPPEREDGTLVRVLGPACAMLGAALFVGAARDDEALALAHAVDDARRAVDVDDAVLARRVAFVTAAGHGELCDAARNAWLEGLCAPEPPSWDVLQIAHGPFQEFFEREITLLALERAGVGADLFDRLARMLVPERHALVRLRSSLAAPLAAIEHHALTCELALRALRVRPRDLAAWPGSGRDAPLYDVGRE